jgi:hypothetical protein
MIVLVYAGIFTDELSGAVAVVLGCTGILGGAAHYGATLAGRSRQKVEFITALGFFGGILFGAFALAIDALT